MITSWDKSHLVTTFLYGAGLAVLIFEDFCVYIHERYWAVVWFSCAVFGFGIRAILASQNQLRNVPSLIFWKCLWRLGSSSSCLTEFTRKANMSWAFLCGKIVRSKFNFFTCYRTIQIFNSWVSFGNLSISRFHRFHLSCLVCWYNLLFIVLA